MTTYYILFFAIILLALLIRPKSAAAFFIPEGSNNRSCNFVYRSNKNNNASLAYVIIVSVLIGTIIGFRKITVGADTASYISLYFNDVVRNGVWRNSPEIVLRIIARICIIITPNYQFFLAVNGYLIAFLFGKFIYDNSHNALISYVIFLGMFFVQSMNLMREWLAIGIILNAYTALKRGHYKTSLFLILISVLTHLTAICFIAVPIIGVIKNKKRAFFVVLIGCSVFYFLRNKIFGLITSIIPRYAVYIYGSDMVNESAFNAKDLIFVLILFSYVYAIFFSQKFFNAKERGLYLEYSILLIIALTFSICGQRYFMLHRVVFYFSIFLLVSLPNFIEKLRFKLVIYFFLIISMFYMLYRNSYNDNNGISNYLWFWQ